MKPNERKTYNDVPSEVNTDPQRNAQVSVPPTSPTGVHRVDDTRKAAYHDGYVHGRVVENSRERDLRDRDSNNAARGLLLGILFASLVGLVGGTLYYLSERNESPTPAIVPVPQETEPEPEAPQTIERERTIIERVIPIPQEAPETPADNAAPTPQTPPEQQQPEQNINITVPNSQTQETPPEQPESPPASAPQIDIKLPEMKQETNATPEATAEPAAPPETEAAPEAESAPEMNVAPDSQSQVNESAAPATDAQATNTTEPANESGFAIPADPVE